MNLKELLDTLGVTQPNFSYLGQQPPGDQLGALTGAAPQAPMQPQGMAAPPPDPSMGLAASPPASSPMLDQAAGIAAHAASTPAGAATMAAPPPSLPSRLPSTFKANPALDAAQPPIFPDPQHGTVAPVDPAAQAARQADLDARLGRAPPPAQGPPITDPLAGKGYGYIPQMNFAQRLMLMGAGLKDLGDIGIGGPGGHYDATLGAMRQWDLSMAQRQQRQQMIQGGLFANDPLNAYGFVWSPDDVTKAAAERVKPQNVREGSVLYPGEGGGQAFAAPHYGNIGPYLYAQTPTGMTVQGATPLTPEMHAAIADIPIKAAMANAETVKAVAAQNEALVHQYAATHDATVIPGYSDADGNPLILDKSGRVVPVSGIPGIKRVTAASTTAQDKVDALTPLYGPAVAKAIAYDPKYQDPQQIAADVEKLAALQEAGMNVTKAQHQAHVDAIRNGIPAMVQGGWGSGVPTNPYAPPGSAQRYNGAASVTGQ
jgi:hypothetical protein